MRQAKLWKFCLFIMTILTVLALSPLVISQGEFQPIILHLPRTLWAGLIIYILMVVVTLIATRSYNLSNSSSREEA